KSTVPSYLTRYFDFPSELSNVTTYPLSDETRENVLVTSTGPGSEVLLFMRVLITPFQVILVSGIFVNAVKNSGCSLVMSVTDEALAGRMGWSKHKRNRAIMDVF